MSTFTNYEKWMACVKVRFPEAYIQEWTMNDSVLLGTAAWLLYAGKEALAARWNAIDGRGYVNPIITRPFGSDPKPARPTEDEFTAAIVTDEMVEAAVEAHDAECIRGSVDDTWKAGELIRSSMRAALEAAIREQHAEIVRLRALVESAYREGYNDNGRPDLYDIEHDYLHSNARKALETKP